MEIMEIYKENIVMLMQVSTMIGFVFGVMVWWYAEKDDELSFIMAAVLGCIIGVGIVVLFIPLIISAVVLTFVMVLNYIAETIKNKVQEEV